MLNTTKTTHFRGESTIDNIVVKVFEASINESNPDSLTFNNYVINYDLYKANRTAITADQTTFEDSCYAYQNGLTKV